MATLSSPQQEMLKRLVECRCAVHKLEHAIRKEDVLVVLDMQCDFMLDGQLPLPDVAGVEDGVVDMINAASACGAKLIATKSYHPPKHVNFNYRDKRFTIFPPHCIEGTEGSFFTPKIGSAIHRAIKRQEEQKLSHVHICHKGFVADVPSYGGAFPYPAEYAGPRLGLANATPAQLDLTGAFELKSAMLHEDVNAPPDISAVLTRTPIRDLFWGLSDSSRVFVCGVGLDYGVLDTAYCLTLLQKRCIIVADAACPMFDETKGLWSKASDVAYLLTKNDIKLCSWRDVAGVKRVGV